jgi:hypothetical protein
MSDFDQLFGRLIEVIGDDGIPSGMLPVPAPVRGPGFFPGAAGFWPAVPSADFFPRRWLVLAHDFGTQADFNETKVNGCEDGNGATWLRTLALLNEVGISPADCFFTNAVIALRDALKNTGGEHRRRRSIRLP